MIHLVGTEEEIAFFFIHKPLDYYPRLQKYSIFPNYASTTSLNYGAAGCFFNPLENTYGEQKPIE